ncbi:hypothetical protein GUJ93_ZPchr0013g36351 [Zizania palustris]|uniref:Alpha/beta hydrolase fold-3 domain-containing protein n=1 Tax=Zizania palustris TaxID=103762 RepID=A0A8J5X5H0_ZIZPA|nr:hypothetical protein GUJ93_ZPchr0013g36351 [Zizania palustris]
MPTMPADVVAATGAATACAHVVEDLHGFLRVLSDGTILRSPGPVSCPAIPGEHPSVEWKDAVYDKAKNLHVRMYKPSPAAAVARGEQDGKLPMLIHFHGGGFCIGSCRWANVHSFCLRLAAEARAVVLSAGYRLAPEHRLPAAVEDAVAFLRWLREKSVDSSGDGWLAESADFGRVFINGDSAGGTIAHHLAVLTGSAASNLAVELQPVIIQGFILLMPFFGGVNRMPSEADCPADDFLNLDLNDRFWRLSLPAGATRDHPMANPFGPDSPDLDSVNFRPVLVVAGGLDMLRDRAVDYAERLAAMGKPVEVAEFAGEQHGFFMLCPVSDATGELIGVVARFLRTCVAAPKTG